ncbi:MAG: ABC transporter permease [Ignavibacteria bacterium]|jgi:ABC-type transport system involved in multi-copper enzyme maturation permease subunit
MFWTLVQKELKQVIQSPKFITTFLTCSVLILLSIYSGIKEFNTALDKYNTAVNLNINSMENSRSYDGLENKLFRQPSPLQIFSSGVNNDIGRYSSISNYNLTALKSSYYSEDTIFAVFRYMDLTFIFSTVLSLFAILFTYNAINGEKEGGTLKLIFSNSIPRATFIGAKFLGSWFALVVPISIPILLGILMLVLFNVPVTSSNWSAILLHIIISIVYFTFFIILGIFISAVTKKSSTSFLILLVTWISLVFIIPRVSTMTAGQIVRVPSIAEIKSIQASYEKEQWEKHYDKLREIWEQRNSVMANMTEEEKKEYADNNNWNWMQEDEKLHNSVSENIKNYSEKLNDDLRNKKGEMARLALTFSRLSPVSSYLLAAMNIGQTNIEQKPEIESSMNDYKRDFVAFTEKKQSESGGFGGIQITMSTEGGMQITDGRSSTKLDLSEMPQYTAPKYNTAKVLGSTFIDIGLLVVYSIILFGLSLWFFLNSAWSKNDNWMK